MQTDVSRVDTQWQGFGDTFNTSGVYCCSIHLPDQAGSLALETELLVLDADKVPFQMIIG